METNRQEIRYERGSRDPYFPQTINSSLIRQNIASKKMFFTITAIPTNKFTAILKPLLPFKLGHKQAMVDRSASEENYPIPPYDDPLY